MMRRIYAAFLINLALLLFPLSSLASADAYDVSYEHCVSRSSSRAVSSLGHYSNGIVGVNGGGDWEKNPCVGDEVNHFDHYGLYVNTNYPSDHCHQHPSRTNAYNCGYGLGLWDHAYAREEHANSNAWFLDVEEGPGIPWSTNSLDSEFLYGLSSALQTRGATVITYYSTPQQWDDITGGWQSGNYAWYATGSHGQPPASVVHNICHHQGFTGGSVAFYQYILGSYSSGIDYDALC